MKDMRREVGIGYPQSLWPFNFGFYLNFIILPFLMLKIKNWLNTSGRVWISLILYRADRAINIEP
jgi:hypothetical protein